MSQENDFAINQLQSEMGEMRTILGRVAEALTRLALLEERQQSVASTTNRILEQVEQLRERQHEADVANATSAQNSIRIVTLEAAVRELHLDNERHKASLKTAGALIKGAWAAGVGVAGALAWVVSIIPK